jgi:hypothetical protein
MKNTSTNITNKCIAPTNVESKIGKKEQEKHLKRSLKNKIFNKKKLTTKLVVSFGA